MADCVNALKEWTGKASATVVYDSTVDEFTADGLFVKIKGKSNIAIVAMTTDSDVFGGFYSVAVTDQEGMFIDRSIFAFSFESHGRCMTPQRFVANKGMKRYVQVRFAHDWIDGFVRMGVECNGTFFLGNEKSMSFCCKMSRAFEGLENTTLTGKNGNWKKGPFHHCTRLIAVQLT